MGGEGGVVGGNRLCHVYAWICMFVCSFVCLYVCVCIVCV